MSSLATRNHGIPPPGSSAGLQHREIERSERTFPFPNWSHERQRHQFARLFDHGPMKTCCEGFKSRLKERLGDKPSDEYKATAAKLQKVSEAFIRLQEQLCLADYDNPRMDTNRNIECNRPVQGRDIYLDGGSESGVGSRFSIRFDSDSPGSGCSHSVRTCLGSERAIEINTPQRSRSGRMQHKPQSPEP